MANRLIVTTDMKDVAKYAIQVSTQKRPKQSDVLTSIHLWRKAGYFGTADEMMRVCPLPVCKGVLTEPFEFTLAEKEWFDRWGMDPNEFEQWPIEAKQRLDRWHSAKVACPSCGHVAVRDRFADTYGLNAPYDRIATAVEAFLVELQYDADIFMMIAKNPTHLNRAKANYQITKDHKEYFAGLEKGRERYEVLYRKCDISRDIAAGGTVHGRIVALLKA